MDEIIQLPEVTHNAGDDCNEAVANWRKTAESTMEAALKSADDTHHTWALKDEIPKAEAECAKQQSELDELMGKVNPVLNALKLSAGNPAVDDASRSRDKLMSDKLSELIGRTVTAKDDINQAKLNLEVTVDQKEPWAQIGQKKDLLVKACATLEDQISDIYNYYSDTHMTTPPPPIKLFESVDFGDPDQWYFLENKVDGDAHDVVKTQDYAAKVAADAAAAALEAANANNAEFHAKEAAEAAKAVADKEAADAEAAKQAADKAREEAEAKLKEAMKTATCKGQVDKIAKYSAQSQVTTASLAKEMQDLTDPSLKATLQFLYDGWVEKSKAANEATPSCDVKDEATEDAQKAIEDLKVWETEHTGKGVMDVLGVTYNDLLAKDGRPEGWNAVVEGWEAGTPTYYMLGGREISAFNEEYPIESEKESSIVFSQLCYAACESKKDAGCVGADVYGAKSPNNENVVEFGCKMLDSISVIAVGYKPGAFSISHGDTQVAATTDAGFVMPGWMEANGKHVQWYEDCQDGEPNCNTTFKYNLRAISPVGLPL